MGIKIMFSLCIIWYLQACTPNKTSVTVKTDDKGKQSGSLTQHFEWD
tara:strand:+ start:258 stop:398 length:141 start_codon:yes stop_codon:yes gene_type:complete